MYDTLYKSINYKDCLINIYYDENADNPREWGNIATFVCEHPRYNLGDEQDIESTVNHLFNKYVSEEALDEYFCKTRNAVIVEWTNGHGDVIRSYQYKEFWKSDNKEHIVEIPIEEWWFDDLAEELSVDEKIELISDSEKVAMLPISIYDHSGVSIWLGSKIGHPDSRWDCSTIGFAYIEKQTAEEEMIPDDGNWMDWAYKIMDCEMNIYNDYISGQVFRYETLDKNFNTMTSCGGFFGDEAIEDMVDEAKYEIDDYLESK